MAHSNPSSWGARCKPRRSLEKPAAHARRRTRCMNNKKAKAKDRNRQAQPAATTLLAWRQRRWLLLGACVCVVLVLWAGRSWLRGREPQGAVIEIGAILPQTGPGAVFSQYIVDGIELAVKDINAKSQPQVKVLYEDSKNQPREAVTAYNKMVSIKGPPVVLVALSSVAKALAPLTNEHGPVQVYIAVALPDLTDGRQKFRVYPEAFGMSGVMARFSATNLKAQGKAQTSAVLYVNDDFGRVSLEAYTAEFQRHGGRVVFADSYELQQTDFRALISKLKNVEPAPDVIYLSGYGPSYGLVIRQLKEQGVQSVLTADMTMGLPDTVNQAGPAAEGVYYVDGKMTPEFAQRFMGEYKKAATSYAGYAYDIIQLLHQTAVKQQAFTADSISTGLHQLPPYPGAMGEIKIMNNGDSDLQFEVKKVEQGVGRLVPQ